MVRQQAIQVLHRASGAKRLFDRLSRRGQLPQQGQVFPRNLDRQIDR